MISSCSAFGPWSYLQTPSTSTTPFSPRSAARYGILSEYVHIFTETDFHRYCQILRTDAKIYIFPQILLRMYLEDDLLTLWQKKILLRAQFNLKYFSI